MVPIPSASHRRCLVRLSHTPRGWTHTTRGPPTRMSTDAMADAARSACLSARYAGRRNSRPLTDICYRCRRQEQGSEAKRGRRLPPQGRDFVNPEHPGSVAFSTAAALRCVRSFGLKRHCSTTHLSLNRSMAEQGGTSSDGKPIACPAKPVLRLGAPPRTFRCEESRQRTLTHTDERSCESTPERPLSHTVGHTVRWLLV